LIASEGPKKLYATVVGCQMLPPLTWTFLSSFIGVATVLTSPGRTGGAAKWEFGLWSKALQRAITRRRIPMVVALPLGIVAEVSQARLRASARPIVARV